MNVNPYEAPPTRRLEQPKVRDAPTALKRLWRGCQAAGTGAAALSLLIIGWAQIVTFVPGGDAGFYGLSTGLAAAGLLSRRWQVRTLAAVLLVVGAWMTYEGYLRGLRYQEWLRTQ
jgi:hypothetical protein